MKISIEDFARRCNVSRQAIYKNCRAGMLVAESGKIDTTLPVNAQYLADHAQAAPAQTTQAPPSKPHIEEPMHKYERAAVGADAKRSYELERLKQQAINVALKNALMSGKLISRDKVQRFIIEPINTAHQRALTDGAKAIAALVQPQALGGATCEEIQATIEKQLASIFGHCRHQMEAAISADRAE